MPAVAGKTDATNNTAFPVGADGFEKAGPAGFAAIASTALLAGTAFAVDTVAAEPSSEFSDTGFKVPRGQLADREVYRMFPSRHSPVAARPVT